MRGKLFAPLGIVLVFVLLTAGLASAHETTYSTRLTVSRSPGGAVEKGTRVDIFGNLKSEKAKCVKDSKISLFKVGGGLVDTDRTGGQGKYSFTVKVKKTTRYTVEFAGKVLNAVHPHNHVCEASSAGIRVRVR